VPSEVIAAFLHAQLENIENIQQKRIEIWENYQKGLKPLEDQGFIKLPLIPSYASNNAHMFYILCDSENQRSTLISHLKDNDIHAVFHYQSLHTSSYYKDQNENIPNLPQADKYSDCLLRLPFYYELASSDQEHIIQAIKEFYS